MSVEIKRYTVNPEKEIVRVFTSHGVYTVTGKEYKKDIKLSELQTLVDKKYDS